MSCLHYACCAWLRGILGGFELPRDVWVLPGFFTMIKGSLNLFWNRWSVREVRFNKNFIQVLLRKVRTAPRDFVLLDCKNPLVVTEVINLSYDTVSDFHIVKVYTTPCPGNAGSVLHGRRESLVHKLQVFKIPEVVLNSSNAIMGVLWLLELTYEQVKLIQKRPSMFMNRRRRSISMV